MTLTIRKAQESNIEALSKLATDSFVHAYKSTLSEGELLQYSETAFSPSTLVKIIKNDSAIYLIAEEPEGIIGYTHLEPSPAPSILPLCQSAIDMVRLYTKVGCEGRGIGSSLLKEAISLCKQANHDYVWLQVWEGNKKARDFYESYCFESLGTQPYVAKCLSRTVVIMGRFI